MKFFLLLIVEFANSISGFNPTSLNSISGAYGLVQWYPADKLTNNLSPGESKSDIDAQLHCLCKEVSDGRQWAKDKMPPDSSGHYMTFDEFTKSKLSIEKLTEYFMKCYEQCGAAEEVLAVRKANSNKWWRLIALIG